MGQAAVLSHSSQSMSSGEVCFEAGFGATATEGFCVKVDSPQVSMVQGCGKTSVHMSPVIMDTSRNKCFLQNFPTFLYG